MNKIAQRLVIRVKRTKGIQKFHLKFPKMTIGCSRFPKRAEIQNLRIFYK
jgi:hypothetical protein